MLVDKTAEFQMLASLFDHQDFVLRLKEDLFTQSNIELFRAFRKSYEQYGVISYRGITDLYGDVPPEIEMARGADPKPLLASLINMATKRQILEITEKLNMLAQSRMVNRDEVRKALSITPVVVDEDNSMVPGIIDFRDSLTKKLKGEYRFIDTGIQFLNTMMGGEWPRKALTVVIGQPGAGKTALIGQSIYNMAKLGIPSLFFSLEMSKSEMVARDVSRIRSIDNTRVQVGAVNEQEVAQIGSAIEELQSLPIYMIDDSTLKIDEMLYHIKVHKERYGIEAVFIDYLQLIPRSNLMSEHDELGYFAQQLKTSAKENDIAIVTLAQQNRQYQGLQSISGSGKVGQIANTVFEILVDPSTISSDLRVCSIDFVKNRNGRTGGSNCSYIPKYLRFE